MESHVVTERGPLGQPPQLVCLTHAGCTWRRDVAGPVRTGDAIARALLAAHVRERATATPDMMGHPKRMRA